MEPQQVRTMTNTCADIGSINESSDVTDKTMQKLNRKIFELELFTKISHETAMKFQQMDKDISNEKQKLDERLYGYLDKVEAFCDQVWKFAASNDLYASLNKYLDMPKHTRSKFSVLDIERDPEIMQLKIQNDKLRSQLANKEATRRKLEDILMQLDTELHIPESYRENNPEIIRLNKCTNEQKETIDTLDVEARKTENPEGGRQCLSSIDIGDEGKKYDFVTASELIKKSGMHDPAKRSKFAVKKESNVSRKLARGKRRDE